MTNIFLAPATKRSNANEYLQQTVVNGVPRDFYAEYTTSFWGETTHIWGLTTSTKSTWDTVKADDWILFYTKKNRYEYAARVVGKEHNPELGDAIREEILGLVGTNDRDWDFLLFLEKPVSVSISGEEVAKILDYKNNFPSRFIRVTDERLEGLKTEYGDIVQFIREIS